jgi:ribosomal protein L11 methyltransferase
MSWIELRLDTTAEGIDWVRTLLATVNYSDDLDITAIEPTTAPYPFTVRLYLPEASTLQQQIIADLLAPLQRTGLSTALQATLVSQKPEFAEAIGHRIGRFVVLAPDSFTQLQPDEIPLRLEKTLTFGSGMHPTTIVSLRLLDRHLRPEMKALDLGSGSGILSVAMAKLGVQVVAIDNDPIAVQATQAAVLRNRVESQVTVRGGSLGRGSELGHWMNGNLNADAASIAPIAAFDLIVANILAWVHVALAPDYHRALRQSETQASLLITAGFTIDFAGEVEAALSEAGFVATDRETFNEWVALAHRLA